jgi:predicted amidohydrolase YtcJ
MQPLHSPRSGFFKAWPEGRILHEDQLELAFAWQTIRETGATVIFSSDWPVVPVEVMRSIRGACHHVELGRSWGGQQQTLSMRWRAIPAMALMPSSTSSARAASRRA